MTAVFDEAWFASRACNGVRELKAYDPGHDVVAMRARGAALVELGSNENPYGPSPGARAAIVEALTAVHRYPDPRGAALKQALATRHGVLQEQILLGNGSHELLMQLAQVFAGQGDEVVHSQFGFAVFGLAAQAAGASVRIAPAFAADSAMPLGHDPAAIVASTRSATRLIYIANPNNPTGTWLSPVQMQQLLIALPPEVIVVVDEAYAELAEASHYRSALALRSAHPNLAVTRTFSKVYGLAGLRCGYAIAHAGLVAVMERVRESFNVNSLALAACTAALADTDHLDFCVARNAEQREFLTTQLRARGLNVLPSQTNFVLAEFGECTAAVEAALLGQNIVLRPMAGYGLPTYSRITIGTEHDNRQLLVALDVVLA